MYLFCSDSYIFLEYCLILFLCWYPLFAFVCLVVWLLFVFDSFFLFFSCIVKSESPIKIKVTLNDILLELVSTILGSFALLMSFYLWHNLLTVTEIRNLKIQVLSSYLVALSSFILLEQRGELLSEMRLGAVVKTCLHDEESQTHVNKKSKKHGRAKLVQ